jgi:hypothetical protein
VARKNLLQDLAELLIDKAMVIQMTGSNQSHF